jgi:hypothetical protein
MGKDVGNHRTQSLHLFTDTLENDQNNLGTMPCLEDKLAMRASNTILSRVF